MTIWVRVCCHSFTRAIRAPRRIWRALRCRILRDIVSRVLVSRQPLAAVLVDCMAEQLARAETLGKTLDW
jgi:hypothetical protein